MARQVRPVLRILSALVLALCGAAGLRAAENAPASGAADLEAAQKLTRELCEAMARKNFTPLLELIRNSDIRSRLILRMPETYPANPEERQKIAGEFMKLIETNVPKIWAYAPEADRFFLPPRDEKGSLVVTVRFDFQNEQKARVAVFQIFRYRIAFDGLRLVNIETPLAGQDMVSATASLLPAHWPQLPEDNQKLHRKQAVIYAMLRGSHVEAEKAAREALKESPDDWVFRTNLASALVSMKKYDDAREIYRDMLAHGQAVLFAHQQLAQLDIAEQHYDEAIAHLRAVLDGLAEDDWILTQIADAQMLAGKTAEAKATLERALKISPFSRYALEKRAKLKIHEGDLDGAAADLRTIKQHHGLSVVSLLKDADFSKLVLMDQYGDLLDRPSAPKAP